MISDKCIIANRFNTFFTNAGPTLASKTTTSGGKSYKDYLNNPIFHTFSFNPISMKTTVNIIDRLPSKSSCGKDGISTQLLKLIKKQCSHSNY